MKFLFLIYLNFHLINLSSLQECGRKKVGSSFSIGSEYYSRGEWPWLAPMFYKEKDTFFCGSTIISKKHLLTASHCFINKGNRNILKPDAAYALPGKFDFDDKQESGVIRAEFSSLKVHGEWSSSMPTYDADIAIAVLKDEIVFTNFIQPACLPEPNAEVYEVEGTVAGYGISDDTIGNNEKKPKYVEIESVTQEVCLFSHEIISRISSRRMFCAGKPGKNPCKGDSGSGFYVKKGNTYSIIGIVSSSIHRDCEDNQYVLFTNVPKFINWIRKEIQFDDDDEWTETPLKCTYQASVPDNRYECYSLLYLESPNPYVRISSVEGTFEDSKTFTDVDTISIQGKVIYIPDMTVTKKVFPNYVKLFITLTGLKYVERSKLAKMPHLKLLNFFGNEIEHFDEDVFDDLVNLENLSFINNKIKVLEPKLLWKLVNLKEILCYGNPIEAIPRRFFKNNKEIVDIWMGYSKIKKIGVNFRALPKLNLLDLRSNECIDVQGCVSCGTTSIEAVQEIIDRQC